MSGLPLLTRVRLTPQSFPKPVGHILEIISHNLKGLAPTWPPFNVGPTEKLVFGCQKATYIVTGRRNKFIR